MEPGSIMELHPAWRLGNLRMKAPFGWETITRDEMKQVLEHLKGLEFMTWSAILSARRSTTTIAKSRECADRRKRVWWKTGREEPTRF